MIIVGHVPLRYKTRAWNPHRRPPPRALAPGRCEKDLGARNSPCSQPGDHAPTAGAEEDGSDWRPGGKRSPLPCTVNLRSEAAQRPSDSTFASTSDDAIAS